MTIKSITLSWTAAPTSEAGFAELYCEELPRIYNFFRYRFGDGPLAEDLTAETFEKAWRKRHRYRRDLASFRTWLYTIARRVVIDHYRQQPSPQHAALSIDHLDHETAATLFAADDAPEDVIAQRADFQRLSLLLSRLADRDRELVALRYGAGLTNRAIAHLTGLNESNVGVILHRTLQKLRAEWEQPHE